MVSVVALNDHRLPIRCPWQQAHSVPEIPAPGALAEVAADGRHIADLRTGGVGHRLRKPRIILPDLRRLDDPIQRDQRADAHAIAFCPYAIHPGELLYVD